MAEKIPSKGLVYQHRTNSRLVVPIALGMGTVDFSPQTSYSQDFAQSHVFKLSFYDFLTDYVRVDDLVAPTITTAATANCAENATLAIALTSSDDAEGVTWAIRSTAQNAASLDATRFEINGTTLRWASNGTKDFESPNDSNTDNVYVVVVRCTDVDGNTTDKTISVTVTDVAE